MSKVIVWGGIGEKKSNSGTQWYQQDRIYDPDGIAPALSQGKADILVKVKQATKQGYIEVHEGGGVFHSIHR